MSTHPKRADSSLSPSSSATEDIPHTDDTQIGGDRGAPKNLCASNFSPGDEDPEPHNVFNQMAATTLVTQLLMLDVPRDYCTGLRMAAIKQQKTVNDLLALLIKGVLPELMGSLDPTDDDDLYRVFIGSVDPRQRLAEVAAKFGRAPGSVPASMTVTVEVPAELHERLARSAEVTGEAVETLMLSSAEAGADCWLREHDLSDPAIYMVPPMGDEGGAS